MLQLFSLDSSAERPTRVALLPFSDDPCKPLYCDVGILIKDYYYYTENRQQFTEDTSHVAYVVALGFRVSNGNGTVPEISSFNIVSKKESSGQKPFTKIIYIVSQMSVLLF